MIELDLAVHSAREAAHVQDEPALEIALPQVFVQPTLISLRRGKLPHLEALAAQIVRHHQANPAEPLGRDYQELVTEFQPLFAWSAACWDYLLSTEGCRFVPRTAEWRAGIRGDYRVVTDKDYSRLVHRIFRHCVFECASQPGAPSLSRWLRERFWPLVLDAYRQLENPPDPRQRTLTAYSYLRCVPYEFLNAFHHDLVYSTIRKLPRVERQATELYFLHFYTETASAAELECSVEVLQEWLRQALRALLLHDRLVYCLLRQIERY